MNLQVQQSTFNLVLRRVYSWTAKINQSLFWFILASIMLALNFLPNDLIDPFASSDVVTTQKKSLPKIVTTEIYNDKIAQKFKSVDQLILHLKVNRNSSSERYEIIEDASKVLRQRFVHAYSVYGMQENWMAAVAGKLIWRDLAAKVIPDDIMIDDAAACSQISIVLMEVCNKLHIPTRKVGLVGHYAMEAYINGQWFFYDLDMKPNFNAIGGRKSVADIVKNKEQYALYANTELDSTAIATKFSSIEYGVVNEAPAPEANLFHVVTKHASHWGWIIPMSIALGLFRKRKSTLS